MFRIVAAACEILGKMNVCIRGVESWRCVRCTGVSFSVSFLFFSEKKIADFLQMRKFFFNKRLIRKARENRKCRVIYLYTNFIQTCHGKQIHAKFKLGIEQETYFCIQKFLRILRNGTLSGGWSYISISYRAHGIMVAGERDT